VARNGLEHRCRVREYFFVCFFFEFFCLFFPSNVLSWGLGAGCKGLSIRRSKPEGLGLFFFEESGLRTWGLGAGCKGLTIRRRSQGFGARVLGLRTSGLRRSKPEGLGFVFLRSQDLGRSRPL